MYISLKNQLAVKVSVSIKLELSLNIFFLLHNHFIILSQHYFQLVVRSSLSPHQEPVVTQIGSGNVGRLFLFVISLARLDSVKLLNTTGCGSVLTVQRCLEVDQS